MRGTADAGEPQLEDTNPSDAQRDILLRRYLVRDLLWCGLCDLPLVAVLVPPEARYYGCANEQCVRRLVPADVMEQRGWSQFVAINEVLAEGCPATGGRTC